MREDPGPGATISEDEIIRLVNLFQQFEGADDPLSNECREAESSFNSLVEQIYIEKVKTAFDSLTLTQFRSYTRNYCRKRLSGEGPPFPSV